MTTKNSDNKNSDNYSDNHKAKQAGGGWAFPLLLAVVLAALVGAIKFLPTDSGADASRARADWTPSAAPTGETVSLTIDFGNGAKKEFATLSWRDGMTVADLLKAAREYRPGIDFMQRDQGESGFLTSLDGLTNQGEEGKNWLFQVDNRHILVSFCVEKLSPGMDVLCTFADGQYNANTNLEVTEE